MMLHRHIAVLLLGAFACGIVPGAMPWEHDVLAASNKKPAPPAKAAEAEKPDKKSPPPFDMKAYMDAHKQFVQSLEAARAFMDQEKKSVPAHAGMANYFLGELDRARLQAENGFDLVFLYFDHFLKTEAVSNILAGYVGNRLRHLGHGLEDLATELGENIARSPYAKDPRFAEVHSRLLGYQVLLEDVSRRIIPVQ
ncbi:hypothetical protein [Megalodesulfovibrio gigas]|nr:hypothetical protein [Megalodesulfovibrio gigas]